MDKTEKPKRGRPCKYISKEQKKQAHALSAKKWRENNPEKAKDIERNQTVQRSQRNREILKRLEKLEKEMEKLKQHIIQN